MSKTYDTEIDFYIGGTRVGGTCISVTNGKIDTQSAEDEFYAVLRKNKTSIVKDAEDYTKSYIVDHLTPAQEEILKEEHAKNYHGIDDDMPDEFESWLEALSTKELEQILDI